ncbi:MAG: 16S rRNA processing protein RimM [Gluconacetobacter diazotrophicus]|nr:16S rRNA processing protein RimM [Gluconacetobacter diazotrophicus]
MGDTRILMGVIGRAHGVRGLVRIHSYASTPADLASYGTLADDRGGFWTLSWKGEGIAELRDGSGRAVADRDEAARLANRKLFAERSRLPEPEPEEFYFADLIGAAVVIRDGGVERDGGSVLAVHDYGAGASLEIGASGHSELVPFTANCVPVVDVAGRRIVVARPDEVEVHDEPAEAVP